MLLHLDLGSECAHAGFAVLLRAQSLLFDDSEGTFELRYARGLAHDQRRLPIEQRVRRW